MKPLRNAGIAILVGLIVGAITLIATIILVVMRVENLSDLAALSDALTNIIPLPFHIASVILSVFVVIFTYLGFIALGKRFNHKFLLVVSWILLIVMVANTILSGVFSYYIIYKSVESPALVLSQVVSNILFLAVMIVFFILLGVGIMKLNGKVELSKVTGILYIVSGATMIILVGAALLWVAQIFAAVMFLKASKKFEK